MFLWFHKFVPLYLITFPVCHHYLHHGDYDEFFCLTVEQLKIKRNYSTFRKNASLKIHLLEDTQRLEILWHVTHKMVNSCFFQFVVLSELNKWDMKCWINRFKGAGRQILLSLSRIMLAAARLTVLCLLLHIHLSNILLFTSSVESIWVYFPKCNHYYDLLALRHESKKHSGSDQMIGWS